MGHENPELRNKKSPESPAGEDVLPERIAHKRLVSEAHTGQQSAGPPSGVKPGIETNSTNSGKNRASERADGQTLKPGKSNDAPKNKNLSDKSDKANEKEGRDVLGDFAERLNMSGALAFQDKAGNLHQVAVRFGCLIDADGKLAGNINAGGQINFNESAQKHFNVNQKLDIKKAEGAVFHSDNPAQADIVSEQKTDKLAQSWNGTFLDLQNQAKYKCVSGNIFDLSGNLIGSLGQDGKLQLPVERATYAGPESPVKRNQGLEVEDLNTVLGEGLTFVGTAQNNKGSKYPLHFTIEPDSCSGKWLIPKDPSQPQGKQEKYNIHLGMLFNSDDDFCGYFKPPRFNADGSLAEDGQVLSKKIDKGGSQLAVIKNLDDLKNLELVRPSTFKNSIFSVQQHGQTGLQNRTNTAFCLGNMHQVDGQYSKDNGYISTDYLNDVLEHKQEAALNSQSSLEAQKKSWYDYRSWTGGFEKDIEQLKKIEHESDQQKEFLEDIAQGKINSQSVDKLKRMFTDLQAQNMGRLAQIDQNPVRINQLPEDLSKVNGYIVTIDQEKEAASQRNERSTRQIATNTESETVHKPKYSVTDTEISKPIKRYEIKNGELFDDKNNLYGKLVYARDGKLAIQSKNNAGEPVEITDPSFHRSYWQLEIKDSQQGNASKKIELASLPEGVFDRADMLRKAEQCVAEALLTANREPENEAAQHAAKYAEAQFHGAYKDGVNHLFSGLQYGAYNSPDREFINKGPSAQICRRLVEAKEAAKTIDKPHLDDKEVIKTVNGRLRIGTDLYTINHGDLEQNGKKVGKFAPGYVLEFDIHNPNNPNEPIKRYVDLNRANRALLDITIGGSPEDQNKHYKFLGLGPGKNTQNYGYQPGGLLYVDEFKRQVNSQLEKAKEGRASYDDTTSDVIGAVTEWVTGGRSQQINQGVAFVESAQKKFNDHLDNIFSDFTPDKLENTKLNQVVGFTQVLSHSARIFTDTTTTLANEGQQLRDNIQTGLEMAAIQSAVSVATGGLGAIAGSARIASLGLGGRLLTQTARILTTSGGKMFVAGITGAGTSALVRHTKGTSQDQNLANALSGGLEGLANLGGAKALEELAKDASLFRRVAFKGLELAGELKTAARGSAIYSAAGTIRTSEDITTDSLLSNTLTELIGDKLGAAAIVRMTKGGFASRLVESMISNLGDGTTGSWAEAAQELKASKGNNYSTFDLMRCMVEKGAWSSFVPASAVTGHFIHKAQHHNEIDAARRQHIRETRKALEMTAQQHFASQQAGFSGTQLAQGVSGSTIPDTTVSNNKEQTKNGNEGIEDQAESVDNGNDNGKYKQKLVAKNDSSENTKVSDTKAARQQSVSKVSEQPIISSERADKLDGQIKEDDRVPENHQRFYYVQQNGEAKLNETPLSLSERKRLNQLSEYEARNEISEHENYELEKLQDRLAVTPLNEAEKTQLVQLQKTVKDGDKIGVDAFRQLQSLTTREQATNSQVLLFDKNNLDLARKTAGNNGKVMVVDIANKQLKQHGVVQEEGLAFLESVELILGAREYGQSTKSVVESSTDSRVERQADSNIVAEANESKQPIDVNNVPVANTGGREELNKLFTQGDFAAAETLAQQTLNTQTQSTNTNWQDITQTLLILGQSQLKQKKLEQADQTFEKALASVEIETAMLAEQDSRLEEDLREQSNGNEADHFVRAFKLLGQRADLEQTIASINAAHQEVIASIFDNLFDKGDFAAAEAYARKNIPAESEIANGTQINKAAWALASMSKAQYMQGDANKLEQAERALQMALFLTSRKDTETKPGAKQEREGQKQGQQEQEHGLERGLRQEIEEYFVATELALGKFSPVVMSAIAEGWAQGTSATATLSTLSQLDNKANHESDAKTISRTESSPTDPHLPAFTLTSLDAGEAGRDAISTEHNGGSSRSNALFFSMDNTSNTDRPSNINRHDDFSAAQTAYDDGEARNDNSGVQGFLPNVQLDFGVGGQSNRADSDRYRERIARLSDSELKKHYLDLQDEVGAVQSALNTMQAGNLPLALQSLIAARRWRGGLRARLSNINRELLQEMERRHRFGLYPAPISVVDGKENNGDDEGFDFSMELHKLVESAQAVLISEQQVLNSVFAARGIEIPMGPSSQKMFSPGQQSFGNTSTTSNTNNPPNVNPSNTSQTGSLFRASYPPSDSSYRIHNMTPDPPDGPRVSGGDKSTLSEGELEEVKATLLRCLSKTDIEEANRVINSLTDVNISLNDIVTSEIREAAKGAMLGSLFAGRIDKVKQIIDLGMLAEDGIFEPDIRNAVKIELFRNLSSGRINDAKQIIDLNVLAEDDIFAPEIREAAKGGLSRALSNGWIDDAKLIIDFKLLAEDQIREAAKAGLSGKIWDGRIDQAKQVIDLKLLTEDDIREIAKAGLGRWLRAGRIDIAEQIIDLKVFSEIDTRVAVKAALSECLSKGYPDEAKQIINMMLLNEDEVRGAALAALTKCLSEAKSATAELIIDTNLLAKEDFATSEISEAIEAGLLKSLTEGYVYEIKQTAALELIEKSKIDDVLKKQAVQQEYVTNVIRSALLSFDVNLNQALEKYLDIPRLTEEAATKLFDQLKEKDPVWQDAENVIGPFEAGAAVFGHVRMLRYVFKANAPPHDALFAFNDIVAMQRQSGLTPEKFAGNILLQVNKDDALDDTGSSFSRLNTIAKGFPKDAQNVLEKAKAYPEIKTLQQLAESFTDLQSVFSSWANLQRFGKLQHFVEQAELLPQLQELRATNQEKLADWIETLAFHPDSKVPLQALLSFWKTPAEFLGIECIHAPKPHELKKPSNYTDIPHLDLSAEGLRDALVHGSLDKLQVFTPMKVEYEIGGVEIAGELNRALGSRQNNIAGEAKNVKKLFSEVNKVLKPTEYNLQQVLGGEKIPESLRKELEQVLYNANYGVKNKLKGMRFVAEIHRKSDSLAVVAGDDTASCMGFGTGKNNVYMFNPNTAYFTVRLMREDGSARTIAQSVLTKDKDVKTLFPDIVKKLEEGREDLHSIIPGEALKGEKAYIAADNVEVHPNYRGGEYPQALQAVYRDFFGKYVDLYGEAENLQDGKLIIGKGYSDTMASLPTEPNTFVPQAPVAYTDKHHDEVYALSLTEGQKISVRTVSIENIEVENRINPQASEQPGITPLTFEDTLSVAYLESKAFSDNASLREGLHAMENALIAKAINDVDKRRANLSLKYLDKEGRMKAYILAYEGRFKNEGEYTAEDEYIEDGNGQPVIFISDFSSDRPMGQSGKPIPNAPAGKLLIEFGKVYKANYIDKGNLIPIFMNARDETSYKLLSRQIESLGKRCGCKFEVKEIGRHEAGHNTMYDVLLIPKLEESDSSGGNTFSINDLDLNKLQPISGGAPDSGKGSDPGRGFQDLSSLFGNEPNDLLEEFIPTGYSYGSTDERPFKLNIPTLQHDLSGRMKTIENKILDLYDAWKDEINSLEKQRHSLDQSIDSHYMHAQSRANQFPVGLSIDISTISPDLAKTLKTLGAERERIINRLKEIGEEMRSSGIEQEIFRLQKAHRVLRIAYSAEQDKIPPTNENRPGNLDIDPESNYLSQKIKPNHQPFRLSDDSHPGNDMAIYVEGDDGIKYDDITTILAETSDLPRGIDTTVVSTVADEMGGSYLDDILRINVPANANQNIFAIEAWHEGGHAIQHEYFDRLSEAKQKLVIEAYSNWLISQNVLEKYPQFREKLLAREYISSRDHLAIYRYSFPEVFAELRAIHKFSLRPGNNQKTYSELLQEHTASYDILRANKLVGAEELYAALKHEVFEPYYQNRGTNQSDQLTRPINPRLESNQKYEMASSNNGSTEDGTNENKPSNTGGVSDENEKLLSDSKFDRVSPERKQILMTLDSNDLKRLVQVEKPGIIISNFFGLREHLNRNFGTPSNIKQAARRDKAIITVFTSDHLKDLSGQVQIRLITNMPEHLDAIAKLPNSEAVRNFLAFCDGYENINQIFINKALKIFASPQLRLCNPEILMKYDLEHISHFEDISKSKPQVLADIGALYLEKGQTTTTLSGREVEYWDENKLKTLYRLVVTELSSLSIDQKSRLLSNLAHTDDLDPLMNNPLAQQRFVQLCNENKFILSNSEKIDNAIRQAVKEVPALKTNELLNSSSIGEANAGSIDLNKLDTNNLPPLSGGAPDENESIKQIIPEEMRSLMPEEQQRELVDFIQSSDDPLFCRKLIEEEIRRGASPEQLSFNRLSALEELAANMIDRPAVLNKILKAESKGELNLEDLATFIIDKNSEARLDLVIKEIDRGFENLNVPYLTVLEKFTAHIPYDSRATQIILHNLTSSSEVIDHLARLTQFINEDNKLIKSRADLIMNEGTRCAAKNVTEDISLFYLSRLTSLEELQKCFTDRPDIMNRIFEVEASNSDLTLDALANLIPKEEPDEPWSRKTRVTMEELGRTKILEKIGYNRSQALEVLQKTYSDNSVIVNRLLELESTSNLDLSRLAAMVARKDGTKEIISEEIVRGAGAEYLSPKRITALALLQTSFADSPNIMQAIRDAEDKQILHLADLASFLSSQRGSKRAERTALMKREFERGALAPQFDIQRLSNLEQLQKYLGKQSNTIPVILERESSENLKIDHLVDFITEVANRNARTTRALLVEGEIRRGASTEQLNLERLEKLEALAKYFPYRSDSMQAILRLESSSGTALVEEIINSIDTDSLPDAIINRIGTDSLLDEDKNIKRQKIEIVTRELEAGAGAQQLLRYRLNALAQLEKELSLHPDLLQSILEKERTGLDICNLEKFISRYGDMQKRISIIRDYISSTYSVEQLNELYEHLNEQHIDQNWVTKMLSDEKNLALPFEVLKDLCALPSEQIVVGSDEQFKQITLPQTFSSENLRGLTTCIDAWKLCPSMPQELAFSVGALPVLERQAAGAAYRYALKQSIDSNAGHLDASKFQSTYDSKFKAFQELLTQGRRGRNQALKEMWAEYKHSRSSRYNVKHQADEGNYYAKLNFLKFTSDELFGTTSFKGNAEASLALATALMDVSRENFALEILQTMKSAEFVKAFDYIQAEETKFSYESKAKAALSLTLIFGRRWSDWLRQQTKGQSKDIFDVLYPFLDLPLLNNEINAGDSAFAINDLAKLGDWLMINSRVNGSHIELVAKKWAELSPEERILSGQDLVLTCLQKTYPDHQNSTFAKEAVRHHMDDAEYQACEKRWLASQDVLLPFPLKGSDDKLLVWRSGKLVGRFLPRNDPRGLFLGHYTNSCQHPEGIGESCAWHGQESPNGGFFVVEDDRANIVAMSWAWRSSTGGLCFDNCEAKGIGSRQNDVASIYQAVADDLVGNYGFPVVTLGIKMSKLKLWRWRSAGAHTQRISGQDDVSYSDAEKQVLLASK